MDNNKIILLITVDWTIIVAAAVAVCLIAAGIALILTSRKKKARAADAAREEDTEAVDLLNVKHDIKSVDSARTEFITPLAVPELWKRKSIPVDPPVQTECTD